MPFTLVTGGARSGKSTFAQQIAEPFCDVGYIATAVVTDDEMRRRVRLHQQNRPAAWTTYECPYNLAACLQTIDHAVLLLDCVTVYLTNALIKQVGDCENSIPIPKQIAAEQAILEEMQGILDVILQRRLNIVMVTNEVGQGLVPAYPLGRLYRDIAGRVNQLLGKHADEVYLVSCGIPLQIKGAK